MSDQAVEVQAAGKSVKRAWMSVDTWAILIAFTLAALVRAGVLKHIPW